MAHDEMLNIRQLDLELLNRHKNLLWIYFAQGDDWVGQQKPAILGAFGGDEARIVHDESGVQHAFCISESLSVFSEKAVYRRSWADHSEVMGKWIIDRITMLYHVI